MTSTPSVGLRERVVVAVAAGASQHKAAERSGERVPRVPADAREQMREIGDVAPKPRGGDQRSPRIEAHADVIWSLNEERPTLFLRERRDALAERGIAVSRSSLSGFFKRHAITRKKHRPRRRTAATGRKKPSAKTGLGIAPFLWLLLTLRGSGGEDHAPLQEIETRPPVALALDQLEPVDLAFGLAAAPGLGQGSPDRGGVTVQSRGEGGDGRSAASLRFRDPRIEIRGARPPPVAVLFTPEARTRAVKRRARPATALAVSSCSTRVTTAAAVASKTTAGWTRSHASCRAVGSGLPAAGRSGMLTVLCRGLRPDRIGFVRRSATKRCTCRLVPGYPRS